MKIGLVLEGGAMRGVFTAGVLDVFLNKNLKTDLCIGVSAGACLACSFLCKQPGRGFAVMTDYRKERDYCSVYSLLKTGDLFGADFLYHKIPEELYPIDNEAFLQEATDFYTVVTNCITGKPEYLQVKDMIRDVDFVRASGSLPLLARMVPLSGIPYLDGGVSDPIPVEKALEMGCDKVIVILTQHRDYRKAPERFLPLISAKYRKYPNLVEDMKVRHEAYNHSLDQIASLEKDGKIFVIAPETPLGIRRAEKDMSVLRKGYEEGLRLGEEQFPSLQQYLYS